MPRILGVGETLMLLNLSLSHCRILTQVTSASKPPAFFSSLLWKLDAMSIATTLKIFAD